MVTEIVNQQENEDVYPIKYTLQQLEPSPESIDLKTGRKMWNIKDQDIWADTYLDACDIYDYILAAANFSL